MKGSRPSAELVIAVMFKPPNRNPPQFELRHTEISIATHRNLNCNTPQFELQRTAIKIGQTPKMLETQGKRRIAMNRNWNCKEPQLGMQ